MSRRSSKPRDWTWVSHIASRYITIWATREVHVLLFISIYWMCIHACLRKCIIHYLCLYICLGLPGGASGQEPACQCKRHKRHGFDPWVGKISRRRAGPPTPVFLPRESHGQRSLAGYSPWGHKGSGVTEVVAQHTRVCVCVCIPHIIKNFFHLK